MWPILIDEPFLGGVHSLITDKENPHADLVCMLLSNLAKSPRIEILCGLKVPEVEGLTEKDVLGQLMEVLVLGENKKWNTQANFDFLVNVWGDITRVNLPSFCILIISSLRAENICSLLVLTLLTTILSNHCYSTQAAPQ